MLATTLTFLTFLAAGAPLPDTPSPVAVAMGQPFYSGAVIPALKEAVYHNEDVVLIDGPGDGWRCEIDIAYDGPAAQLVKRLLDQRIGKYTAQFPDLKQPSSETKRRPILLAHIKDEEAKPHLDRLQLGKAATALPPQGYMIEVRPDAIFCLGKDNQGVLNAAATLLQLIHVRDDKLVVRRVSTRDWPTFTTRYTAEYHLPGTDFFDWMMTYKINGFGACYPGMHWEGLSDDKRAGLKAIGDYVRTYQTMHFMAQFHVGGRRDRPVDSGDPADIERLLSTIAETMDLSCADHIMICCDDVTPELQPNEKGRFESPAEAHGYLMEQVYASVKAKDPDVIVSFCSPNYQGHQHRRWRDTNPHLADALKYMEVLRTWPNKDIRIVWTGPVTESRWVTQEDITDYRERVGEDRPLFYWDNTWHYHQPLHGFPMHVAFPVGTRRRAAQLVEDPDEMRRVCETKRTGNIRNRMLGVQQEPAGMLDSLLLEVSAG
jgi:beta-N-acetylglucosaminidase/Glycosyl hydrolase family 20, domain 2